MKRTHALILLLLLTAGNAAAQPAWRPDALGSWELVKVEPIVEPKMTAAERQAMTAHLRAVAAVLRAAPPLSPLKGISMRAEERFDLGCEDDPCVRQQLPAYVHATMHMLHEVDGRIRLNDKDPPHFQIAINDPRAALRDHEFDYNRLFDAAGNEIFTSPAEFEHVDGAIVYDNNVAVLARPGRRWLRPVTRETFVRALIKRDGTHAIVRDMLLAELNAMTPEQRRAPAYIGEAESLSKLVEPNAEGAVALVTFDPAYFDAALPRTAPQLITIWYYWGPRYTEGDPNAEEHGMDVMRMWQLRETAKHADIAKLLAQ